MIGDNLAAFLITYERTEFLIQSIKKIFDQNPSPQNVLIVDNSKSDQIQKVISRLEDLSVSFLSTGCNQGPAGAAKIGLQTLSDKGFDWIYWGDDDDPPADSDVFKSLLEIADKNPEAGVVGKVGGKFIPFRARTRVFENSELSSVVEADYVTGGKQMIVSSKVVKAGVLPDPKLFFGFEELEFCLRVKDAGFKVLVDGEGISEARKKAGKSAKNYRWKGKSIGDSTRINRQYYSVRNMLYILWSRGHFFGYLFFLLKNLIKIPVSIRYGTSYFIKFSKLTLIAIYHQWIGRYGQYIPTR